MKNGNCSNLVNSIYVDFSEVHSINMVKDIIGEKANSFDTTIEDNYLMRIAPIDNIHIDGLVSEKKRKSSDVYNNIKPLLIGDSVMVDIGESFGSSVPKSRN